MALIKKKQERIKSPQTPTWCPGCGDFGIWTAFKDAAEDEQWNNTNTAVVAGIGCHGHIVNFIDLSSVEGLHGRALPVASGIAMANHELNIVVFTGDGDSLAEGGNHFSHAARRNHDMLVVLHDNAIYGLTTGQTSPRSPNGYVSKTTPKGNIDEPLHPLRIAIAAGATFVARAYAGNVPRLKELMIQGARHKGFAIIQVLQPCVTFNKQYTHIFYQKNIYELPPEYDRTDRAAAFAKTLEWGEKRIPVGILYEEKAPTHEDQLPVLAKKPLVKQVVKRDMKKATQAFI
jgi:2-oxoglutarate ferredoxin oxidoreductase subunit beta